MGGCEVTFRHWRLVHFIQLRTLVLFKWNYLGHIFLGHLWIFSVVMCSLYQISGRLLQLSFGRQTDKVSCDSTGPRTPSGISTMSPWENRGSPKIVLLVLLDGLNGDFFMQLPPAKHNNSTTWRVPCLHHFALVCLVATFVASVCRGWTSSLSKIQFCDPSERWKKRRTLWDFPPESSVLPDTKQCKAWSPRNELGGQAEALSEAWSLS